MAATSADEPSAVRAAETRTLWAQGVSWPYDKFLPGIRQVDRLSKRALSIALLCISKPALWGTQEANFWACSQVNLQSSLSNPICINRKKTPPWSRLIPVIRFEKMEAIQWIMFSRVEAERRAKKPIWDESQLWPFYLLAAAGEWGRAQLYDLLKTHVLRCVDVKEFQLNSSLFLAWASYLDSSWSFLTYHWNELVLFVNR